MEARKTTVLNLDEMLSSITLMDTSALKNLSERVDQILASRKSADTQEADLLAKIKALIPASVVRRYRQLHRKQQNETITDKERSEILLLTDFMEEKSAERVALLVALAQLRKMPVADVARQLRIRQPYV